MFTAHMPSNLFSFLLSVSAGVRLHPCKDIFLLCSLPYHRGLGQALINHDLKARSGLLPVFEWSENWEWFFFFLMVEMKSEEE